MQYSLSSFKVICLLRNFEYVIVSFCFIIGTDDKSKQFSELLENINISTKLESELFVAIKIEADTVPHQQFTQICMLFSKIQMM